jgi:hypothetical protein
MTTMQDGTLHLFLKDGHEYHWVGCTNIREAAKEVRWTNLRGEKRSMAKVFLDRWEVSPALPKDTEGTMSPRDKDNTDFALRKPVFWLCTVLAGLLWTGIGWQLGAGASVSPATYIGAFVLTVTACYIRWLS